GTGSASGIASGDQHTCAIVEGVMFCWGASLGQPKGTIATPERVGAGGGGSRCSGGRVSRGVEVASGDLSCWGKNASGELGLGDKDPRKAPTHVDLGGKPTAVGCGPDNACAILNDGTLWCWGRNDQSQLARAGGDSSTPVRVGAD